MVLSTLYQQWMQRLETLEEELRYQPADQRWLIALRIKILRFMLARYADSVTRWPEESASPEAGSSRRHAARAARSTRRAAEETPVEHPPRRGETMTTSLDAIAIANRIANPPTDPEDVWSWWSTRWLGGR